MKKKDIEIPETTDFSPKAFKKLQRELAKKNRKWDGYRPMTFKLRQMGFNLNHKTVLKLMNELGIHPFYAKKDMENVEKHRILPRIYWIVILQR